MLEFFMNLDMDGNNPEQGDSLEEASLADSLSEVAGGNSEPAREARLEQQVANAVATLAEAQQIVVKRLFGLDGQPPSSHEEIAAQLTASLSEPLREQLALECGESIEDFVLSVDDVRKLEADALRNLRGGSSQGI